MAQGAQCEAGKKRTRFDVSAEVPFSPSKEYLDGLEQWMNNTVGMPPDFVRSLSEDDDWVFFIKLHAFIEAALNHILTEEFGNPELSRIFSRLETSNPRIGKIAFIKACDALSEQQRLFVKTMSEVRNYIVHDIKNFGFDLASYIGRFDKTQLQKWNEAIHTGIVIPSGLLPEDVGTSNPRLLITISALVLMMNAYDAKQYHEDQRTIDVTGDALLEAMSLQLEQARLRIAELERAAAIPRG